MINIKIASKAEALTADQRNQLVELHLDFIAHQTDSLQAKPGPAVKITPTLLFSHNVVVLAVDDTDDRVVGYVLLRNLSGDLTVRCIYVNPLVRQNGVMAAMLNVIAAKESYYRYTVMVPPKSEAVENYYNEHGFTPTDVQGWSRFVKVVGAGVARYPSREGVSEVLASVDYQSAKLTA